MPAWLFNFLKQNGLTLALFALLGYYIYTHESGPGPYVPPEAPVTIAARNYLANLPKSYETVKAGVLNGTIKDFNTLMNTANAGAAGPMADAFQASISAGLDPKGNITNPPLVAQAIDDLLKGLR